MPSLPKVPCKKPGCAALVEAGCCAAHAGASREVALDRPSAAARGYGRRWQRYRLSFLAVHPICARCGRLASQVDHQVPVSSPDDPLFWDAGNHQPLCRECHSQKTAQEDGGFGRRRAGR